MDRVELRRYSRQILLPQVALAGQDRLRRSSVLVVGAGGLGSPVLSYLAAAGVGRLGLAEHDLVDATNLQRQVLFSTADVGRRKSDAAVERIRALNAGVAVTAFGRLDAGNAEEAVRAHDLVVDAADNFATRYLVSDTCSWVGRTWVWGAAQGFDGMASVFDAGLTLRDAFPNPPESQDNCDTIGVFGPLVGVVGAVMAGEALKALLGLPTLRGRLWLYDALEGETRTLSLDPPGR